MFEIQQNRQFSFQMNSSQTPISTDKLMKVFPGIIMNDIFLVGLGRISGLAGYPVIFNIRPVTWYLADFLRRISGKLPDIEHWPDIRPEPDIRH